MLCINKWGIIINVGTDWETNLLTNTFKKCYGINDVIAKSST